MQSSGQAPPAAVPAERTIGQLVADTLRFYNSRLWVCLPLGVPPALLTVTAAELPRDERIGLLVIGWPLLMTISYVAASFLVLTTPYDGRRALVAFVVGLVIALPVPLLVTFIVLPAVLWLALVGMAVPAAVVEATGVRASVRRGVSLAKADYVHAAGTVATLVLVVVLTQLILFQLLHGLSHQAIAAAAFLANLVISPVLFIGSALLYEDQVARARVQSKLHPSKEA